jgi:hypothetical protein
MKAVFQSLRRLWNRFTELEARTSLTERPQVTRK